MSQILNHNAFFVKEHTGIFKAANNFDIYNPETQELLMTCREENLGFLTKMFRFSDYKRMTPFDIEVKSVSGEKVISVRREISLFLSTVHVYDAQDRIIGMFKQHFFSFGGTFDVLDENGVSLCMLKGKLSGWNFKFIKDTTEFAQVTKKWAGVGKELFTTADNYVLTISEKVPADHPLRKLILAAVLCIDMVLKE